MPRSELDLVTLVAHVDLKNISFFEISAKLDESVSDDSSAAEDNEIDAASDEVESIQYLQTSHRDDDGAFRIRIRSEVTVPAGSVVADVAGEYELEEFVASDISPEVLVAFANEVAVMQLIPYLRQAIADVTQRVFGDPLIMPMLQRGQMVFRIAQPEGS